MKSLLVFLAVCVAVTYCQSCAWTWHCFDNCSDGYLEQCVAGFCKCPEHNCDARTKCPQGDDSGCPPSCSTTCTNNVCACHC